MPLQGIRGASSKLPAAGQVSGRIARGRQDDHGITRLPCDGQVSGRRRQPGCKKIEQCTGSTDEEGTIAELEMMVEKKTTELKLMKDQLTKRNIDVETLEKRVKSYEEIESVEKKSHPRVNCFGANSAEPRDRLKQLTLRNQVHHNTEHCDASIKAQTQLIKYQDREIEDLNNQLKERDHQQEVYQQKLKNMTDLMELQTRRMDKQDNEYRKLKKQLQETNARCEESVVHEQTQRKELDKMQQKLNDEVNEKKKLQNKIELQSKQAVNQEKRETEMQNEICQLQTKMREKYSELEDKNKRYIEAEKRLQEITKENRTTIANINQQISAQALALQKQETHIERTTTEISELKNTLKDTEQKLQHSKQRSLTKDPIVEMQKRYKKLVVAIDIGSSHSGYALSFKHDYNHDPTKVYTNQNWVAGSMALMSLKAPTCVLFDENKQFHSFGYEAENTYVELALDDEHHQWYFFKDIMYRKVTRELCIEDIKGRKLPAMLVYGELIKYLKGHCLDALRKRETPVDNADIHWVLPVSANWAEPHRNLMSKAAYQADIAEKQLSIVPEPEAAALFVQYLPTDRINGSGYTKLQQIGKPGSRFMVIDLGGNTADITVYTRQPDGGLKELHEPTRGPYGGTKIDEEFNQLLIRIVGAPFFKQFCDKNKADVLDLQREFQIKKRIITPGSIGKITIKVPKSIAETYPDEMGESVKDAIANSPFDKKIQWIEDKVRIDADIFKGLFKTCCGSIVKMVNDVLQTRSVKGTNIFLLVGGFSESEMVQDAIKKAFPNVHIIIPDEAGLNVLKGAVIYGHRPLSTTE